MESDRPSDPPTELQCVLLRDTLRSPQDRLKAVLLSEQTRVLMQIVKLLLLKRSARHPASIEDALPQCGYVARC